MNDDTWWNAELSVIDENAQQGLDNETLVPWLLGKVIWLRKPLRDVGEDYTFAMRGDPSSVEFAVQSKSTRQSKGRFELKVGRIHRWLSAVSRRPVVFLLKRESDAAEVFWMCTLHEWLLAEPDVLQQRIEGKARVSSVSVPLELFGRYERNNSDEWRSVLLQERSRVLGTGLFSAPVNVNLDIAEGELFAAFGNLASREVPADVVRWALATAGDEQSAVTRLQDLRSPDVTKPNLQSKNEIAQFKLFVAALRRADEARFPMPEHTWRDVATWRTFVLMYPGSLILAERVLQRPGRWRSGQVCSALALIGLLACGSQDPSVRFRAESILASSELREAMPTGRVDSRRSYLVTRQYLYACAEAHLGEKSERRFLDFMTANGLAAHLMERQLHLRYYNMVDVVDTVPFIERQLTRPAPRQENTRRILEEIMGVLEAA